MNRRPLLAIAALALSACATYPAGEDPTGKEMKQQATLVLVALASYEKDRGELPTSLYELVPKYLTEVPFGPNLSFSRDKKLLRFDYTPSWPQGGFAACVAQLGQQQWQCQASR